MESELESGQLEQTLEQTPEKVAQGGLLRAQWCSLRTKVLGELVGVFHRSLTEDSQVRETPMWLKWKPPAQYPTVEPRPHPPEKSQSVTLFA